MGAIIYATKMTQKKLKLEATYALPYSVAHLTLTWLGRMGDNLHWLVMFTGLGGRLGSTPVGNKRKLGFILGQMLEKLHRDRNGKGFTVNFLGYWLGTSFFR